MKNDVFLKQLESFQNSVVDTLLKNKKKLIFVKGHKFTGKTKIVAKLFNIINDELVIYHTGCDPKYYNKGYDRLIRLIEKYNYNSITFILDEFYDEKLLNYITNLKNATCYIFTNDTSIKNDKFVDFNYYIFYTKFINNIYKTYLNIHQILQKENYEKIENLRSSSTKTITNIKYLNKIYKNVMEFNLDNIDNKR